MYFTHLRAMRMRLTAIKSSTPGLRSEECGHVEYACICQEGKCFSCGCKLDKEEIEAGREQCFDCYCIDQD